MFSCSLCYDFLDTFKSMKVNEDNMEQSSPYPDRPGERDCQFFLRTGQCGYGNTCRYNHPLTHLPQVRNLVDLADSY